MKFLWVDAISDSSWINVESTRNSEQFVNIDFSSLHEKEDEERLGG